MVEPTEKELLIRIDERVEHVAHIDIPAIKAHLAKLNNKVEKNVERIATNTQSTAVNARTIKIVYTIAVSGISVVVAQLVLNLLNII